MSVERKCAFSNEMSILSLNDSHLRSAPCMKRLTVEWHEKSVFIGNDSKALKNVDQSSLVNKKIVLFLYFFKEF